MRLHFAITAMNDSLQFFLLTSIFLGYAGIVGGVCARAAQMQGGLDVNAFSIGSSLAVLAYLPLLVWGAFAHGWWTIAGLVFPVFIWSLTPAAIKESQRLPLIGLSCAVIGLVNLTINWFAS